MSDKTRKAVIEKAKNRKVSQHLEAKTLRRLRLSLGTEPTAEQKAEALAIAADLVKTDPAKLGKPLRDAIDARFGKAYEQAEAKAVNAALADEPGCEGCGAEIDQND